MKKNWMQLVNMCLCALLLVLVLVQGQKLNDYQALIDDQMARLNTDFQNEMENLSFTIEQELEDASRVVLQYELEPKGIDKETHTLIADVSLSLKEWTEDTQVTLLATVGGQDVSLPLEGAQNGVFSGELSFPLDDGTSISFSATVSGGGLTRQESLGDWGDISMLLPLRQGSLFWSGRDYTNGVMSGHFGISVEGQDGLPPEIHNPVFQVFKNGTLVQTLAAVNDPYSYSPSGISYTTDTEDDTWRLECAPGDAIEFHFLCEDSYGLGYDFLFAVWNAGEEELDIQAEHLTLYWP